MVYSSARRIGVDESMGRVSFTRWMVSVPGTEGLRPLVPCCPTPLRPCLHFSMDFLSDPRASSHIQA